ncbi:beta-ketoacyl synthase N-terminal-like domain-containing protein [Amycolatopsis suaedae]|uniref:Beta-ketoacyl synthase n=1 Tax=Amycolatopsis suaedae TaxID=2510978 RepID=A0A4Q7J3A0_9PSEU|nr:beta-ketoacyl synthase N-terminal-like domain-containing protein [Amycolatopsis suaedae]RZQ61092.1 beta-ketoacyl synthase [Amycolatopsis suaedae]
MNRLVLTGWAVHLPGIDLGEAVAGGPRGRWAAAEAAPPERAASVLGRKGLLATEPATRLALCAVHSALGLEPGRRREPVPDPATAVLACSTLGALDTVASVARTLAREGGKAVSVLDAPNVSPNVVASRVALWFGFGGPNLLVTAGGSARSMLRLAALLLRSGRAGRVVLVGAEPGDATAVAVHGGPVRAGAACAVLTDWRAGVPVTDGQAVAELDPRPLCTAPLAGFDPAAAWGDFGGAADVIALALAAHLAVDERHGVVGVGRSTVDGVPAVSVHSAPVEVTR